MASRPDSLGEKPSKDSPSGPDRPDRPDRDGPKHDTPERDNSDRPRDVGDKDPPIGPGSKP